MQVDNEQTKTSLFHENDAEFRPASLSIFTLTLILTPTLSFSLVSARSKSA